MDTSRQDFFNDSFFKKQSVFVLPLPLQDLVFQFYVSKSEADEYFNENPCLDLNIPQILNNFSSEVLTVPAIGWNKVVHHIQKVIWLIQSYCIDGGWKYPVKAVNMLDNGKYTVHPGVNRCVAARFLKCNTLDTHLTVHKEQQAYTRLPFVKRIESQEDLRAQMVSDDVIYYRTEIEETLFVAGRATDKKMIDYTYEFAGNKHWPSKQAYDDWVELIFNSFPLSVNVVGDFTVGLPYTNKYFYNQKGNKVKIALSQKGDNESKITIELHRPVEDVLSLLFFMHPYYKVAMTQDGSVKVINHNVTSEDILIIPNHCV